MYGKRTSYLLSKSVGVLERQKLFLGKIKIHRGIDVICLTISDPIFGENIGLVDPFLATRNAAYDMVVAHPNSTGSVYFFKLCIKEVVHNPSLQNDFFYQGSFWFL